MFQVELSSLVIVEIKLERCRIFFLALNFPGFGLHIRANMYILWLGGNLFFHCHHSFYHVEGVIPVYIERKRERKLLELYILYIQEKVIRKYKTNILYTKAFRSAHQSVNFHKIWHSLVSQVFILTKSPEQAILCLFAKDYMPVDKERKRNIGTVSKTAIY